MSLTKAPGDDDAPPTAVAVRDEDGPRTYRLWISYRGDAFFGWQAQPAKRSVQGELQVALSRLMGREVFVRGAGRTDRGVHARRQGASIVVHDPRFNPRRLIRAFAAVLPQDVAVVGVDPVPRDFDAKRDSVGKRYLYRVLNREAPDPLRGPFAWHERRPLDVSAMQRAARHLVGEHDFESFRASSCVAPHARRCLWMVEVERNADLVVIEVRGNAFCQHMVRIIAGTLVDVGLGKFTPDAVEDVLAARNRRRAGRTAPAHGLTLDVVYYADDLNDARIPPGYCWPGYPPEAPLAERSSTMD